MKKTEFFINRESLERLGIDPEEVITLIENTRGKDLSPVFIASHFILKYEKVNS